MESIDSGVSSIRRPPKGVHVFSNMQDAVVMLQNLAKQNNKKQ